MNSSNNESSSEARGERGKIEGVGVRGEPRALAPVNIKQFQVLLLLTCEFMCFHGEVVDGSGTDGLGRRCASLCTRRNT